MLDSSYLRASDPNSMRNLGHPRNVIYNFDAASSYNTSNMTSISKRTPVPSESSRSYNSSLIPKNYQRNVKINDYTKNISEPLFNPGYAYSVKSSKLSSKAPSSVAVKKSI